MQFLFIQKVSRFSVTPTLLTRQRKGLFFLLKNQQLGHTNDLTVLIFFFCRIFIIQDIPHFLLNGITSTVITPMNSSAFSAFCFKNDPSWLKRVILMNITPLLI